MFRPLFGGPSLIYRREDLSELDQLCVTLPPRLQIPPRLRNNLPAKLRIGQGVEG